jgi:hypothetical protein
LRAAAKSSTQTKSNTRAPAARAISRVRSTLPVSTTMISSKIPRTDSRQWGRFCSSSRTIIVRLTLALRSPVDADARISRRDATGRRDAEKRGDRVAEDG